MTGAERILRALKNAGSRGITPVDFAAPNVCDGEKPIMRVAARILDLRAKGHLIDTTITENGVAVYVLKREHVGNGTLRRHDPDGFTDFPADPGVTFAPSLWAEPPAAHQPANALTEDAA